MAILSRDPRSPDTRTVLLASVWVATAKRPLMHHRIATAGDPYALRARQDGLAGMTPRDRVPPQQPVLHRIPRDAAHAVDLVARLLAAA